MPVLKIKPNPECKACHGYGDLYDSVPYGSTNVSVFSGFCDCVLDQISEDDDSEIELVIDESVYQHVTEPSYNVYDEYSDLLENE